jgi:glutamine phosphoribosylpyrophosphate amidotransferase
MKGKDGRLIANEKTVEEIRAMSGADSLSFLPLKVLRSVWPKPDDSCFACMDGRFWD